MADSPYDDLVTEAFFYGFPLVFNLEQVERFVTTGIGALPPAPFNVFGHATALAGPADTFVSVNNDTLYSIAQLDVSGGPLRLEVPDTDGRYYVLQFVDAWTNNFAYVGARATGTDAGSFLLVPPGWDGAAPDGARVIRLPTAVATIVGRFAVDGDEDLPAVAALQAALTLAPAGDGSGTGLPAADPGVADDLAFFERLRVAIAAFPPAARDVPLQERFRAIGLLEPESPYADPDPELAAALRAGLAANRERMETALAQDATATVNGWRLTYHLFDYNLDFFEVGALDDPQWKIADPKIRYIQRALAARAGLWGNHGYEAAYAMSYEDGGGAPLGGAHRYEIRFATAPPVDAFWSITMYDLPEFHLVENAIDRYSVGDRTPGLVHADDGSLTITLQRDAPADPAARANWLPTPAGLFRPILRLYEPREAIFDGTYTLPPITRLADPPS